ncbi:hypothetical protein [Mesorhizobium sp. YR577]|uniref:hypothetical protein n=1 Tax=Mesorhizobium sp. YR577 TaxID=1884373 RepID=UPI000AE7FD16|nr:hypothetical protein [Mesorhizobium sp. YR577]
MTAEHGVPVRDASGADTEVPSLLAGYGYEHVCVFHGGREPRNNLGDWAAYNIEPPTGAHCFAVHAAKDREMARRADCGLMIWDGALPGPRSMCTGPGSARPASSTTWRAVW